MVTIEVISLILDGILTPEMGIRDVQATLSDEEAQYFRTFIRTSEIQKIRHALYGALLYSPLYLLTHRKLSSNAWDQEKMLMVRRKHGLI